VQGNSVYVAPFYFVLSEYNPMSIAVIYLKGNTICGCLAFITALV
jgi:hypothetical protein